MVVAAKPSYRLTTEALEQPVAAWRFQLAEVDGDHCMEIGDEEPGCCVEVLGLLAIIRGLEAIGRPSRVWLSTSSRYVHQGLTFGLEEWRQRGWRWERFGSLAPIKHCDLWQRVDRALNFHDVATIDIAPTGGLAARNAVAGFGAEECGPGDTRLRQRNTGAFRVHRLIVHPRMPDQDLATPKSRVSPRFTLNTGFATSWRVE